MDYYCGIEDYASKINHYKSTVNTLMNWLWSNTISLKEVEEWLDNFDGTATNEIEHEKLNAIFLLKQYMFFGMKEFRKMLHSLYYNKFFKPTIHELLESPTCNIDEEYEKILNLTRFISIGNPSESGGLLLYLFRQENDLPTYLFWNVSDVFTINNSQIVATNRNSKQQQIKNYVFIDDISGSGSQAYKFFVGKNRTKFNIISHINKFNPGAKIYYFTLFNTTQSRIKLNQINNLIVKSIFELDDTYKTYNLNSRYFTNEGKEQLRFNEIQFSRKLCEKYSNKLNIKKEYKFGFENSQLLLSFFYNTPNNTIPLFWKESNHWNGLFKRYKKL